MMEYMDLADTLTAEQKQQVRFVFSLYYSYSWRSCASLSRKERVTPNSKALFCPARAIEPNSASLLATCGIPVVSTLFLVTCRRDL